MRRVKRVGKVVTLCEKAVESRSAGLVSGRAEADCPIHSEAPPVVDVVVLHEGTLGPAGRG